MQKEARAEKPVEIFYVYSRKDEGMRNKLDMHLRPMMRQKNIKIWHDRKIGAGGEWENEIDVHLNMAQLILLLISPAFLASDYCYGTEMERALERHERGEARVIPIILRPVDWSKTPLGKLQVLPTGARPITGSGWRNQDEAFLDVVRGIRHVIEEILHGSIGAKAPSFQRTIASPTFPLDSEPIKITEKKHILIVEDTITLIKCYISTINNFDEYYISYVLDGREALDFISRIHVDLIILDIMMARVGGLTVIETLRQNNNRVPIIAISYDHLMGNEAIKLGANFFIAKPFQPDELREKVKEVFFGKE